MKGTILDIFVVGIILLIFSITILVGARVLTAIDEGTDDTTLNQTLLQQGQNNVIGTYDSMFLFLTVGAFLATIIGAFFLNTHPVFFIVSLIIFIFMGVINVQFAEVFLQTANQTDMQSAAATIPNIVNVWLNYPIIVMIFAVILIIVLYAKIRGVSDAGY